ncbi:copper chaperone PCu(A)C [soil metagenome]
MKNTVIAAAMVAASILTGCSSAPVQPVPEADAILVQDAWVKAADHGMTAAFGRLSNSSAADVRIVSATTAASGRVELHEVVSVGGAMTMRPKDGGIVIPANADVELTPGGDHLMLMDLTGPLLPGSDIEVIATLADGSTLPIAAQVRDFPGADEHYDPGTRG